MGGETWPCLALLTLAFVGGSSLGSSAIFRDILNHHPSSLTRNLLSTHPSVLTNEISRRFSSISPDLTSLHKQILKGRNSLAMKTKSTKKQSPSLWPFFTKTLQMMKNEALQELKATLIGVDSLPSYPRYSLPPLTTILQSKKQQALNDLTIKLRKTLGDSGMMDSNLVSAVIPSVQRLVEEPDLLPSLARTVGRHFMQDRSSPLTKDEDRKPTPRLIEDAGFLAESHGVVTDDGYMLTVHRIVAPGRLPKPVVFLQHGLLCSSADWVIGDRSKAFGFLLADAGYDVWLGNFRGNLYSRNHTSLDPEEEPFWRFSWDHMGTYDLPAMLDMVMERTGQEQLTYIGHSMGTTSFWVMMNMRPWMNAKIRLMVGLAPVAAVPSMYSPLRYLTPVATEVEKVLSLTGQYEFGARDSLFSGITETLCERVTHSVNRNESACAVPENIIFAVAGFDAPQMNFTLLPVIVGHTPAGTSSRTVLHFAQGVQSSRFRQFDFGDEERNLEEYGSTEPPEYSLAHVTCPVVLYWGQNDWLTQPRDVAEIARQLPGLVASIRVPYDSWNHLDFLWGKDADSLLYKPAMAVMADW